MLASSDGKNLEDEPGNIAGMIYVYTVFQMLSSASECRTGIVNSNSSTSQTLPSYGVMITTWDGNDIHYISPDMTNKKTSFTFHIRNDGIKKDSYRLNITSSKGWNIENNFICI